MIAKLSDCLRAVLASASALEAVGPVMSTVLIEKAEKLEAMVPETVHLSMGKFGEASVPPAVKEYVDDLMHSIKNLGADAVDAKELRGIVVECQSILDQAGAARVFVQQADPDNLTRRLRGYVVAIGKASLSQRQPLASQMENIDTRLRILSLLIDVGAKKDLIKSALRDLEKAVPVADHA